MDNLNDLIADIRKSTMPLEPDSIFRSIVKHLYEECTKEEIEIMLNMAMELDQKTYESWEDFIEDYQPILDVVDFPIQEALRFMEKRKSDLQDFIVGG